MDSIEWKVALSLEQVEEIKKILAQKPLRPGKIYIHKDGEDVGIPWEYKENV